MQYSSHTPGPTFGDRRNSGFNSFKTEGAIRFSSRWTRDALIQATLDPGIVRISECPFPVESPPDVRLAFLVSSEQTTEVRVLCEHSAGEFEPPPNVGRAIYMAKSQVLRDPDLTVSRAIWATRHHHVPVPHLVAVTRRLREAPGGMLVTAFHAEAPLILAMACIGLVNLNWQGLPLGDITASLRAPGRLLSTADSEENRYATNSCK